MSFEVTLDDARNLVVFRTSGMLTRADYQTSLDEAAAVLRANEGCPLLCDWSELEGWADDSRDAYAYHSWLDNAPLLRRRIAILCHAELREHAYWFMEFAQARGIEVEAFSPERRNEAIAWLEG